MKNTFTGKTRLFLCISGAIIAVALIMQIAGVGMNLGIDFTGGSLLSYSVGENYDIADVETILESAGYEGSQITKAAPSDVSSILQMEAAVQQAQEPAEATGTLLNTDKSGIEADGLTDLQIRLMLVDESEGLDAAVTAGVQNASADAQLVSYGPLTNSRIVDMGFGSEFAGGYIAEFSAPNGFVLEDVYAAVEAALQQDFSVLDLSVEMYDPQTEDGADIAVLVNIDDQASQVRSLLETEMTAKYPTFRFVSVDHVSAIAGHDLMSNAVKALLIAFACMLVYIAVRFDVFSGLAALFGLMHDVLIMCAFMVFFRAFFQVNSSFIAAVLTIVGYSINNTIIVFDRIRETSRKPGWGDKSRREIVEVSVKNTLSRTINTSLTTLITLVALYAFGVDSIREFAFPLIVGMLAGTYSSVMLSGQVWAMWMEKRIGRKAKKA